VKARFPSARQQSSTRRAGRWPADAFQPRRNRFMFAYACRAFTETDEMILTLTTKESEKARHAASGLQDRQRRDRLRARAWRRHEQSGDTREHSACRKSKATRSDREGRPADRLSAIVTDDGVPRCCGQGGPWGWCAGRPAGRGRQGGPEDAAHKRGPASGRSWQSGGRICRPESQSGLQPHRASRRARPTASTSRGSHRGAGTPRSIRRR
jgi:hypothetical protein